MLVYPNNLLTVSMGTPLDNRMVVAAECLATWYVKCVFIPHNSALVFNILLQVVLLGIGKTLITEI